MTTWILFFAKSFGCCTVFSASSDLVMAAWNTEFCDACGGIEELKNKHAKAVRELEQWYADGDDSYCR